MINKLQLIVISLIFVGSLALTTSLSVQAQTTTTVSSAGLSVAPANPITITDFHVSGAPGFWHNLWLHFEGSLGLSPAVRLSAQKELATIELFELQNNLSQKSVDQIQRQISQFKADEQTVEAKISDESSIPAVANLEKEAEDDQPLQLAMIEQMRIDKANLQYQSQLAELSDWAAKKTAEIVASGKTDTEKQALLNQVQAKVAAKDSSLAAKLAQKVALAQLLLTKKATLDNAVSGDLDIEAKVVAEELSANSVSVDALAGELEGQAHDKLELLDRVAAQKLSDADAKEIQAKIAEQESQLETEINVDPTAFTTILNRKTDKEIKDKIENTLKKDDHNDVIEQADKEEQQKETTVKSNSTTESETNTSSGSDGSTSTSGGDTNTSTDQTIEFTVTISNSTYSGLQSLKKGVEARIHVKNEDSMDHSFTVKSLNIDQVVRAGQEEEVRFTPTTTGSFAISCDFHPAMAATLVIN